MGDAGEAKWRTASSGPSTKMKCVTSWRTKRNRFSGSRCAMLRGFPVRRLSIAITSWPSARRRSQRWLPRKPAPPVTSTLMRLPFSRPSDALVAPAVDPHLAGLVDVPQVDHDGLLHPRGEAWQVERAELVPLGREHDAVGALGAVVRVPGIVHA